MLHPTILHHLMLVANLLQQSPFEWASNHIHMVAWPTICLIFWKAGNAWRKFLDTAHKTISQIDNMATNHFPHMEESLQKQDGFLQSMDKNIGRMADVMDRERPF